MRGATVSVAGGGTAAPARRTELAALQRGRPVWGGLNWRERSSGGEREETSCRCPRVAGCDPLGSLRSHRRVTLRVGSRACARWGWFTVQKVQSGMEAGAVPAASGSCPGLKDQHEFSDVKSPTGLQGQVGLVGRGAPAEGCWRCHVDGLPAHCPRSRVASGLVTLLAAPLGSPRSAASLGVGRGWWHFSPEQERPRGEIRPGAGAREPPSPQSPAPA